MDNQSWGDIANSILGNQESQPAQEMGTTTSGSWSDIANSILGDSSRSTDNSSSSSELMPLIQKYFPPDQWQNAYAVASAESGGNPQAVGDNYPIDGQTIPSYGLFQIRGLPGRPDPQTLLNPEQNVAYAAQMWSQQGWQPWTTARRMGLPGTTPLDQ